MKIEDFISDIPTSLPVRNLDFEKIMKLSDDDFAELYLLMMKEYKFWEKGKRPNCWECKTPIEKPEELRRLFGGNYHPDCFREVYSKSDDISKEDRKYFDRIAKLKF